MKRRAIWSSLVAEYGEKGLEMKVSGGRILRLILPIFAGGLWGFVAVLGFLAGVSYAPIAYAAVAISFVFAFTPFYYKAYHSNQSFIIVYDDEFVISADLGTHGPGFVRLRRDKYWIDVLARDAEVYDLEECGTFYTIVFNKPVRGTMFIRLYCRAFNINDETLQSFIEAVKPRRVLINGLYYPHIYAIFKMFYGDEYPELAEGLLRDFSDVIARIGLAKVSTVMNALRSLCFANRKEEAVRLAKAIVTGEIFRFAEVIDESEYLKWYFHVIRGCYPWSEDGLNYCQRIWLKLDTAYKDGTLLAFAITLLIAIFTINFATFNLAMAFAALTYCYIMGTDRMVYWSRVSMRDGYGKLLAYLLGLKVIDFMVLAPMFLFYPPCLQLFWVFILFAVVISVMVAFVIMIQTNYMAYRVGLRDAEKLLSMLSN